MKVLGKSVSDILVLIVAGAMLRLAIAPLFMDTFDFAFWTSTAFDVRTGKGIYWDYDYWYPPVWGYIISLLSPLVDVFGFAPTEDIWIRMADDDLTTGDGWVVSTGCLVLFKLPIIMADLVNGILIHRIVMKLTGDEKKAVEAAAIWLLNPLSIWVSSGHGQFDSIALMFVLLAVMAFMDKSYIICGMSVAAATLTKVFPAFAAIPLLMLILVSEKGKRMNLKGTGLYILGGIGMTFLILLPQIINGEMGFVTSFITGRLFDSHPVPSGFDPTTMSFFSERIYPQTNRSEYLLPSFLLILILSVFIAVRRPDVKKGILLITASLCVYLIWLPAPGYTQYYVIPVGMLALCSAIDRRFGYLALASGIVGVLHLYSCFEYASPMVVLGWIDLDTLYRIHDMLGSAFGIFDGLIKALKFIPMLLSVVLILMICRRDQSEA